MRIEKTGIYRISTYGAGTRPEDIDDLEDLDNKTGQGAIFHCEFDLNENSHLVIIIGKGLKYDQMIIKHSIYSCE